LTDRLSDGLVRSAITRRHLLVGAVAWSAAAVTSINAAAQTYPNQNISLIVPFTPGGSTDILARLLGQKLETALKYPVVVESRPGAGGSIGVASVARAAPDGHTLVMGHIGTLAVNPAHYPKLQYDSIGSFEPVSGIANVHNMLVVHPEVPAKTLQELVDYAKQNPGKLNYEGAPTVPTVAESGYPGFEASQWYGILVPAGTPKAVVERLNTEIRAAMAAPEIAERLSLEGAEVWTNTPDEFRDHIADEMVRWGDLVRRTGIKAE